MFCVVFFVRNATLSCASLKGLVISVASFPQYVKMAHFVI
jgi:hypothetical protein